MKIGESELEPLNIDIPVSTFVARRIFMLLILETYPEVAFDLVRPFKEDDLPVAIRGDASLEGRLYDSFFRYITEPDEFHRVHSDITFTPDIQNSPIMECCNYVDSEHERYSKLLRESKDLWSRGDGDSNHQRDLIELLAHLDLIPNWSALLKDSKSTPFRQAILRWAVKWNLKDEWCLDFAIWVLLTFKVFNVDKIKRSPQPASSNAYFRKLKASLDAWAASSWKMATRNLNLEIQKRQYGACFEGPQPNKFEFEFRKAESKPIDFNFTCSFLPTLESKENFAMRAERFFWEQFLARFGDSPSELVGHSESVSSEIERFRQDLTAYVKRSIKMQKPFHKRVLKKNSGNSHFCWLVEYQIKGMRVSSIAEIEGIDRKTVSDGVNSVAEILKLSLRPATKTGRKPGTKDLSPFRRHRVNK